MVFWSETILDTISIYTTFYLYFAIDCGLFLSQILRMDNSMSFIKAILIVYYMSTKYNSFGVGAVVQTVTCLFARTSLGRTDILSYGVP